ncbi:MAG: hypothetical protein LBC94_08010 [Desulfovibrio sp.]|jgi:hypothetical protein|nr:hypothetical protein [Desulfovibrio sp.]
MGKALQIRVSAVTWNEDLPEKLWPKISELAFSVAMQHEKRGVLEMVRALDEGLRFMNWPETLKASINDDIHKAAALKRAVEDALADWKPGLANRLSDELENVLDRMENNIVT